MQRNFEDPPDGNALLRHIAEENRRRRAGSREFAQAVEAGDAERLVASIEALDNCGGWRSALRQCARLRAIQEDMKSRLLELWRFSGDHIRLEVGDDRILIQALRAMLPPYDGPDLTLYRGDSAWNRRRRTYGLSWSGSREVADSFAAGALWRSCRGGSVLLQAQVPAEAVISAPALLANGHGEDEYLVDRRHLSQVTVVKRYAEDSSTAMAGGH
jgi:hypothetical protein